MKIDVAVKIIIVLLVIMIVSLVSVIVLIDDDGKDEKETTKITSSEDEGTTGNGITPPDTSDGDTSSSDSSEIDTSDPDTSESDTTDPDSTESDTSEPDTSEPDTSEPDGDELPGDILVNTTLRSDTGTKLNLVADIAAYEDDGRVKVVIEISLEHYSLSVRSRTCSLVIGDETVVFSADAISYSGSSTKTVLYTYEGSFDNGQTLDIFVEYPYNGTYGGTEIDDIRVIGQVTLG